MLYSHKGKYPEQLPNRIRMPDGLTRTKPFSEDDLFIAGYHQISPPSSLKWYEKLDWSGTDWVITQKDISEIWSFIRKQRDEKIKEVEWRYNRYYRHERLGLPQIDSIQNLDTYIQALADITKQTNPYAIIWPVLIV